MEDFESKLVYYSNEFDEKNLKKLNLVLLSSLIQKMKDKEDVKVKEIVTEMFMELDVIRKNESPKLKKYFGLFSILKKHVKDTYGYVPKGSVQGEYMAIGVALGVAFGAAFMTINTAFIGLGIPIGIAIGLAVGSNKEKELEEQNKTY